MLLNEKCRSENDSLQAVRAERLGFMDWRAAAGVACAWSWVRFRDLM